MISDLFKNARVQYAYNKQQKIYSVRVNLDKKPYILTLRVGGSFTELSVADQEGNVLEVLRQEDGKGATFSKLG